MKDKDRGLLVLWKINARTLSPMKDESEDFESDKSEDFESDKSVDFESDKSEDFESCEK